MGNSVVTLAERPELAGSMWSLPNRWPEFMLHDPAANLFYGKLSDEFPELQLVAVKDGSEVVGKLAAVPMIWDRTVAGLPDRGWDAALEQAFVSGMDAEPRRAVCLLEALVSSEQSGRGLSRLLLIAAKENAARLGFLDILGPIRPSGKAAFPLRPITEYIAEVRADGLPVDPWLRTHVRLGGRILKICLVAMTIAGTLNHWRSWTGLELTATGATIVPGALTPVHISIEHDHGVYIEPNVWMRHQLVP